MIRLSVDLRQRSKRLGATLKSFRQERGLSQKAASLMVGITQGALSKLERTGSVSFALLERFALVYDKPLSDFATLDEERSEGKYFDMTDEEWNSNNELLHRSYEHKASSAEPWRRYWKRREE
jgi:transcriptional regulator with XRE-family HTH domain